MDVVRAIEIPVKKMYTYVCNVLAHAGRLVVNVCQQFVEATRAQKQVTLPTLRESPKPTVEAAGPATK